MKKNLFEIKTEEVQRILSLHEERSKTQYLNIISEQDNKNSSYVLDQDQVLQQSNALVRCDYYVLKGAKFEPTTDPSIIRAKGAKVNKYDSGKWNSDGTHYISYYCRLGKFFVSGDNKEKFTNQTVANKLKPMCGKVNYQSEKAKSGKTFKQGYDQPFYKDGTFAFNLVKGSVLTWDGKNATTKNITSGGIVTGGVDSNSNWISYLGDATFSCTQIKGKYISFPKNTKFSISDSNSAGTLGKLTKDLRNQFCFSKVQNSANTDTSTQPKVQQKSNFTALYTIQNNHDLGPVKVNTQDIIIKSFKYPDYAAIMRDDTPIAYYNCKSNTWGNIEISDTKGALTGTIKEKVCPQVLTPTNVSGDTSTQTGSTTTQQVNRQQQFAQRTVTAINNVQKTLGVPQTGQLKNSDIEDLLNKLK